MQNGLEVPPAESVSIVRGVRPLGVHATGYMTFGATSPTAS